MYRKYTKSPYVKPMNLSGNSGWCFITFYKVPQTLVLSRFCGTLFFISFYKLLSFFVCRQNFLTTNLSTKQVIFNALKSKTKRLPKYTTSVLFFRLNFIVKDLNNLYCFQAVQMNFLQRPLRRHGVLQNYARSACL